MPPPNAPTREEYKEKSDDTMISASAPVLPRVEARRPIDKVRASLIDTRSRSSTRGSSRRLAPRYAVVIEPYTALERHRLKVGEVVEVLDTGGRKYWLVITRGVELEVPNANLSESFRVPDLANTKLLRAGADYVPSNDASFKMLTILRGDLFLFDTSNAPLKISTDEDKGKIWDDEKEGKKNDDDKKNDDKKNDDKKNDEEKKINDDKKNDDEKNINVDEGRQLEMIEVTRVRDDAVGLIVRDLVHELPLPEPSEGPLLSTRVLLPGVLQFSRLLLHSDLATVRLLAPVFSRTTSDRAAELMVELFDDNDSIYRLVKLGIQYEVEGTKQAPTLFRSNSFGSLILSAYNRRISGPYLKAVVAPALQYLCSRAAEELEIDPNRMLAGASVQSNMRSLEEVLRNFVDFVTQSVELCPHSVRFVCYTLREEVEKKFPGHGQSSIGGFLFLRCICPAIVAPVHYGVVDDIDPKLMRSLILVSKVLQTVANGTEFGQKEPYMVPMNEFVRRSRESLLMFYEDLVKMPEADAERTRSLTAPPAPNELLQPVVRRASIHELAEIVGNAMPRVKTEAGDVESQPYVALCRVLEQVASDERAEDSGLSRELQLQREYRDALAAVTSQEGELSARITAQVDESELSAYLNASSASAAASSNRGSLIARRKSMLTAPRSSISLPESASVSDPAADDTSQPQVAAAVTAAVEAASKRDTFIRGLLDTTATDEILSPGVMTLELPELVVGPPSVPDHLFSRQSYAELQSDFEVFQNDLAAEIEQQRRRRSQLASALEYDSVTTERMAEVVSAMQSADHIINKLRRAQEALSSVEI